MDNPDKDECETPESAPDPMDAVTEPESGEPDPAEDPEPAATPGDATDDEPGTPSPREIQRAATRATKEALIQQAELVAMASPPSKAPAEMQALMEQWKQAGRITKSEDAALWARFKSAQDQLFTKLDLLRAQRNAEMAEAGRRKESLIATAEEVANRSDLRQATETMAGLMAEWKQIGPAKNDNDLWQRFKAARDLAYRRSNENRRQSAAEQKQAAAAKRAIIAQVQSLVGSPDLKAATAELKRLQEEFRTAGYPGRDLNRTLGEEFSQAQTEFYRWLRGEPSRRRETGQQETYSSRSRLVRQIDLVTADIAEAEAKLTAADPAGVKRSHGRSITLTLGAAGSYHEAAAEAMRLRVRLADLQDQLARMDAQLSRQ